MKKKIIFSFFLIFLLFSLGAGATISRLVQSTSSLRNLIKLHEIEDIRQDLNLRVQKVKAYVLMPGLDFSYNLAEVVENVQLMEETVQKCYGCHHREAIEEDIRYTERLVTEFQEKLSYLITTVKDVEWRRENQRQASKIADAIVHHVQDMVNRAAGTLQQKTDLAMGQIHRSYIFLITTLGITFVTALLIAHYLTKTITDPISQLQTAARKITEGELGYTTTYGGKAEFGELLTTFNQMSKALAEKESENNRLYQDLQHQLDNLQKTKHQLIMAGKLASLGKLAGGIAHDFNNILCGIVGHISIIKNNLGKDDPNTTSLDTMQTASFRASKLVDQLMTFASVTDWQEVPVDINNSITMIINAKQSGITQEIKINKQLTEDLCPVLGDPDRLQELLNNILSNAIHAIEPKGQVDIATEHEPLKHQTANSPLPLPNGIYVKISIKDNGKGIPKEVLPRVFDPYFSTKGLGPQKGLGLGMAIAYSIVSKHEGHIKIDSQEGQGTVVEVYLPAVTGCKAEVKEDLSRY